MTDLISGKRYRLTFEGTADGYGGVSFATDARFAAMDIDLASSVELLPDPLPTTPGSVIQLRDSVFARTDSKDGYHWKRVSPYTKGDFWGDSDLEGATVLFEAGA